MELYIIRHGRTVWNAAGKIQGSADIELTEEGREAARLTGQAFAAMGLHFDAVYASPLMRAFETAQLISSYTRLPIIKDERIRELNFGVLEGQSFEHLENTEFDLAHGSFFTRPECYQRPENGESLEEICARAQSFLDMLQATYKNDERILIVAHGAMNKALLKCIKHLDIRDFWSGDLQKNCGVSIIRIEGDRYEIIEESKVFYALQ